MTTRQDFEGTCQPELPVFINLRKTLRQRCWLARKGHGGSDRLAEWCLDAFDLLTEPTLGTQREVWKAVAQNPTLRRSLSAKMSNMSEDARVRSYLDTRRRHVPTQHIAGEESSGESLRIQMTSRLVQDPKLFAGATGVLFRAPDRIKAEELLSGMRWITDLSSNALVPGAHALTASDVHDFISRWDSANFVHAAEGKILALDFSVYLRFDAFALNPEESTTSSGKCIKPTSLDVKWKKLVNLPRALSQEAIRKRKEAWHFARHATRQREAIVLLAALRDEYASSLARNSVATTALDRDLQFKAKLYLGRQSIVGQISPLPGLAMYLAAMESDSDRGLVTLAEARLALAQCEVFLTARETFLLGEIIGKGSTPDDMTSITKWSTANILVTMDASPLPCSVDGKVAVSRWLNAAKSAICRYSDKDKAGFDEREVLQFMVGYSKNFAVAAIENIVQGSLVKYYRFKHSCRCLEEKQESRGIDVKNPGALSISSIKYAARIAGCCSPSFFRQTRVNTLSDAFSASSSTPATSQSKERQLCWQSLLRRCSPLHALLAHEKSVGMGNEGVSSDNPKFDRDIEAVCASIAAWMFGDNIVALCREFERRDQERKGVLPVDAFAAAVTAAGYGSQLFGAEEKRWALAVCHHHAEEGCISYAKYMAMVLVALERAMHI